jgi:hypothetical protein
MKHVIASSLAVAIAATSAYAADSTSTSNETSRQPCAIGYVTGVGGSARSVREYLASPDRDKYRYLTDNPIQCQISDEGRASDCTGITSLRRERASVYDDSDDVTTTVVARVELDRGTYPVVIVAPKQDMQCEE